MAEVNGESCNSEKSGEACQGAENTETDVKTDSQTAAETSAERKEKRVELEQDKEEEEEPAPKKLKLSEPKTETKTESPVNGEKKQDGGEKEEEEEEEEETKENGGGGGGGGTETSVRQDPNKMKLAAEKCKECDYKCWTDAEMKVHCQTSHGGSLRRQWKCGNCNFVCTNTWEMDYHARSRGHKAQQYIPCKKCDALLETKEEALSHRKVHIPPEKLHECGECSWVGDRLDNMRYHVYSQDHKPKRDYEAVAKAKAEEQGPKALKHYQTKLARDIKKAQNGRGK